MLQVQHNCDGEKNHSFLLKAENCQQTKYEMQQCFKELHKLHIKEKLSEKSSTVIYVP